MVRSHPIANPIDRRRVTRVVAGSFEALEDLVPPKWLPRLSHLRRGRRRESITAEAAPFGCGEWGCVYPTLDRDVVLKITEDVTEAEFAEKLAGQLARPICVVYHKVIAIDRRDTKQPTYLLWRESAEDVGKVLDLVENAEDVIADQHIAAEAAYKAAFHRRPIDEIRRLVAVWKAKCLDMARIPELAELGQGMAEVLDRNHVLFGDVHAGNIGRVTRDGVQHWVITDPGNIAVIE